jgi:hypothetical protein
MFSPVLLAESTLTSSSNPALSGEFTRYYATGLNLATATQILSYTYNGPTSRVVMSRVSLGDGVNNLSGVGGIYELRVALNSVLTVPVSDVTVPAGATQVVLLSRPFLLYPGDTVTVTALGQSGDNPVNVTTVLRDDTPVVLSDILGPGSVQVNQDYGSPGALSITTAGGVGVVGATILVYLASDYAAGNTGEAYVIARTTTIAGGAWASNLYLTPNSYTLLVYRLPDYAATTMNLTVQ